MTKTNNRCRLVGINHVALTVDNIEEALSFYRKLFDFKLRGRTDKAAFIDMGDQFLAISEGPPQPPDKHRHFGLVVDDREQLRKQLEAMQIEILPTPGLDFIDPWGNRIQVVIYNEIQFTKTQSILQGMGFENLDKSDQALAELRAKDLIE